MAVVPPHYPCISTDLRKPHSHHVGFFVDFEHITKRSLLLSEILDKSALKRKLVHSSKYVFHTTP